MNKKNNLSTLQLVLFSTGGIIGSGWLFSPFYGFQTAGVWVLLSWLITAVLSYIVARSFAEVSCMIPIIGGGARFIGATHNRSVYFVFIALSWLSIVVYLPLEAQSAIQYLGFFWHGLVIEQANQVTLSHLGLGIALIIMIFLTWLNCFLITHVNKINSAMGIWKIIIPAGVALFFIFKYGSINNINFNYHATKFSLENVLIAITSSGLAFAFTGFQNGIALANNAKNPGRSLPYSLFSPIVLGGVIYMLLSLGFISCLNNKTQISHSAVAPLLGLVALFGINFIYVILFADAVVAPLGTANVYTAVTGRVLYGLAKDFVPDSFLNKLNKNGAPSAALWLNAVVGIVFLLPFPTWRQLVDFLSSVVVFAYLAGPIAMLVLRKNLPTLKRDYKIKHYNLVGYLGFACCGLFIYWSELFNLVLLLIAVLVAVTAYIIFAKADKPHIVFKQTAPLIGYVAALTIISFFKKHDIFIVFPWDNIAVILVSFGCCKILTRNHLPPETIGLNIRCLKQDSRSA